MADETTTKEEQKIERIKCPCCGEMTLVKPLDIKSEVLDEYMASIITGIAFAHTYTIHDAIDITVEVPLKQTALYIARVTERLDKLQASLLAKDPEKASKLRNAIGMIHVYGVITSIVTRDKTKAIKSYTPAEAVKRFMAVVDDVKDDVDLIIESYTNEDTADNMSTVPDIMLRAIIKTHTDLYNILLDTGFNETFWKGIELA